MTNLNTFRDAVKGRYPPKPEKGLPQSQWATMWNALETVSKEDAVAEEQLKEFYRQYRDIVSDAVRFARWLDAVRKALGVPMPSTDHSDECLANGSLFECLREAARTATPPTPDGWCFAPEKPDQYMVEQAIEAGSPPGFVDHYRVSLGAISGGKPEGYPVPQAWKEEGLPAALNVLVNNQLKSSERQKALALQQVAYWMEAEGVESGVSQETETNGIPEYGDIEIGELANRARSDAYAVEGLQALWLRTDEARSMVDEYARTLDRVRRELGVPPQGSPEALTETLVETIRRREFSANENWMLVPLEADERMIEAAREAGASKDFATHYRAAIRSAPGMKTYPPNAPQFWVDAGIADVLRDMASDWYRGELSTERGVADEFKKNQKQMARWAEVMRHMAEWIDASKGARETA